MIGPRAGSDVALNSRVGAGRRSISWPSTSRVPTLAEPSWPAPSARSARWLPRRSGDRSSRTRRTAIRSRWAVASQRPAPPGSPDDEHRQRDLGFEHLRRRHPWLERRRALEGRSAARPQPRFALPRAEAPACSGSAARAVCRVPCQRPACTAFRTRTRPASVSVASRSTVLACLRTAVRRLPRRLRRAVASSAMPPAPAPLAYSGAATLAAASRVSRSREDRASTVRASVVWVWSAAWRRSARSST